MAKKGNFLGGIFDFNRDGHTSFTEKVIGYDVATNIPGGGSYSDCIGVGDNDGILNIDTDDWRYEAEDNPVKGVDPWDYDSEEDYLYAVEDMVNSNHSGNSEAIDLNNAYIKITLKTDEEVAADKIQEQKEYEEMRKDPILSRRYDAQEALDMAEIGHIEHLIPNIELYKFILESPCIAAKYLYDYGEFCYLEAVTDNFDIPENVLNHPDSDSLP